jgi:hypothetical protein
MGLLGVEALTKGQFLEFWLQMISSKYESHITEFECDENIATVNREGNSVA